MTRKDEFKSRALRIAAQSTPYHLYPLADEIIKSLLEVEREVWARVDEYYSRTIHHDMDDYPDKFVKWVREQKEAL